MVRNDHSPFRCRPALHPCSSGTSILYTSKSGALRSSPLRATSEPKHYDPPAITIQSGAISSYHRCALDATRSHELESYRGRVLMRPFALRMRTVSASKTAQLRKQPACAQVAYDAAADARSSPGAADSCAKWSRITQARRKSWKIRDLHARRRDPALRGQMVSAEPNGRLFTCAACQRRVPCYRFTIRGRMIR